MEAAPAAVGRYADAHLEPNGAGDGRPTAFQILQDNDVVGKLNDKTFLVTGGTAGLGLETVRQLAKTGARVFLAARNPEKAERVVQELLEDGKSDKDLKNARIEWVAIDNASLKSIKSGVEDFLKRSDRLNGIVCNAGLPNVPFARTEDGFEMQFGVNHLGHFYLFELLKPLLLKSATPSFQSRVVTVSSGAHAFSTVQIGNYNLEKLPTDGYWQGVEMPGDYNPMIGYGNSKTANVWFANEIERRYGSQGIHGLSIHPGAIYTDSWSGMDSRVAERLSELVSSNDFKTRVKSLEQGAATQVLATIGKDFEGKGGLYLEDCGVAQLNATDLPVGGYREYLYNPEGEKRLWIDSLEMVGLKDDQ